jgi:cbb3-type cytochrome oxidase subunit 3
VPDVTEALTVLERIEVMFGPAGAALIAFIIVLLVYIWFMMNRHEAERNHLRNDAKEAFGACTHLAESNSENRQKLAIALTDLSKEVSFIRDKIN